jgi:hypothetical protein
VDNAVKTCLNEAFFGLSRRHGGQLYARDLLGLHLQTNVGNTDVQGWSRNIYGIKSGGTLSGSRAAAPANVS